MQIEKGTETRALPGPRPSVTVKISRAEKLPGGFRPLAPPRRVDLLLDRVGPELISNLSGTISVGMKQGFFSLPLFQDQMVPLEIGPDTRAEIRVTAGRVPGTLEGESIINTLDVVFESPIIIHNIIPILTKLHTLFKDRDIARFLALAGRVGTSQAINTAVELLEGAGVDKLARGLLAAVPPGLPGVSTLKGLLSGLQGATQELTETLATVMLSRISARPKLRGGVWHLDFFFTGEINYLDRLTIPFVRFKVPRVIIPEFHAALDKLISDSPMASADLMRDRIPLNRFLVELAETLGSFEGQADLSGSLPALRITGTSAGQGSIEVDASLPEHLSGRLTFSGTLSREELTMELSHCLIQTEQEEARIAGSVSLKTQEGADERGLVKELLDKGLDAGIVASIQGSAAPGSRISGFSLAMKMFHPLLKGETSASFCLSGMNLDGSVEVDLDQAAGGVVRQQIELNYGGDFQTRPGTGFFDGQTRLQPTNLTGQVRGTVTSSRKNNLKLHLSGQADAALESITLLDAFPELSLEDERLSGVLEGGADFDVVLETRRQGGGPYELDFQGTSVNFDLLHGALIWGKKSLSVPEESEVRLFIKEGILANTGLGRGAFELGWDFRGRSPVLATTGKVVEIFVPELRQGSFVLEVSPAGGLSITGPEWGLYDAHYFNALINPGKEVKRWLELLESEESVDKLLATFRFFSQDAEKIIKEVRKQVDRGRRIIEEEGIKQPRDLIPGDRIARLLSKLLKDTDALVPRILPLVKQVTDGRGLDVPAVKRLLADTLPDHEYEYEVDRLLRWTAKLLAPVEPELPFKRSKVLPLSEDPNFTRNFKGIPSAARIYKAVDGKEPLEPRMAAALARVAPYFTLNQLEYIMARQESRWDTSSPEGRIQLARLRHVLELKRRVNMISQGYGGVGFVPQAFAISFFLGEIVALTHSLKSQAADETGIDENLVPRTFIGPGDLAVLLQSGLASAWSGRAVQLNQRMLLAIIEEMPSSFLHGVLVELGGNSPRVLAGVLMALLDLDQSRIVDPVDVVSLFTGKLGIQFPRREDYMAGGRWARMSYYEALNNVALKVFAEAKPYSALKYYIQEVRHGATISVRKQAGLSRLEEAAIAAITAADEAGALCRFKGAETTRRKTATKAYEKAFAACAALLAADPAAFHRHQWFKEFWSRNHEALVILSVVRNVQEDVDQVRGWFLTRLGEELPEDEQILLDKVIDVLYFEEADRAVLKADPLVRLLIEPGPGHYDFTIVSCMGVVTEGARGTELEETYRRILEKRGIPTLRADTATGRSLDYNAEKVIQAIRQVKGPWGYIGYSQGCANGLTAESTLAAGTPEEQALLSRLVCRNFLFSAMNGSAHGTAGDRKLVRAMIDMDHFLAHYQARLSRKATDLALRTIRMLLDARPVVLGTLGMHSLSHWGVLHLNMGGQFKPDIPSSTVRGIVETGTLPEALEFFANILTVQIESSRHDTQVAAGEAVGHLIWADNAQSHMLQTCDMGSRIQRTHHWSPLNRETEFVTTERDRKLGIYDFPKDRHVFPWVEVNARFGIIKRRED